MANAFTKTRFYQYGGPNGQDRIVFEGTLVIDTTATGGATAGDLPASMFGLRRISRVSNPINSTDANIYPAAPSADGTSLMIGGGTDGAAADLPNATYKLTIEGVK